MTSPVVFISYSHDSDAHRERVLGLSERLRQDGIDSRLDQYVNGTPPEGWPRWMLDRLDEADFVLVVCTQTYYRRFRGQAAADTGKGVDFEGACITQELYDAKSRSAKFVAVMFDDGQEEFLPEPLRGRTHYTLTSEASYQALYDFLLGQAGVEAGKLGDPKRRPRPRGKPLTFDEPQKTAPTRLTHVADTLFGREEELAELDKAWADPGTHVVTLVAWGGVGKTSLVAKWAAGLSRRDYDGADYFDWSFYSQGTRELAGASADAFVAKALAFFGDPGMAKSPASPWDKGARLAELIAGRKALLLLDGLEPLQHPPGPLAGELTDPTIQTLLKGLAARNPGLCVVTTRERVKDLASFRDSTAPEHQLRHLATPDGVKLLESLGVHGAAAEIVRLAEDVKGHALTLNLLGGYLRAAHAGDVRKRDLVRFEEADDEIQGGHAFRVMAAYEKWLATEGQHGKALLAVLRLLGLFDRPASADCLAALRRAPVIAGLTEPLFSRDKGWRGWLKHAQPIAERTWDLGLSRLAACGLVSREGLLLDAHPLIREYFAHRLREDHPGAWRAAHNRLFGHLKSAVEARPETLEGLRPLYQAVAHGCQAGRQQDAWSRVYVARILRGTGPDGHYSWRKTGAFGTDLAAVACFFEAPWSRVTPALAKDARTWLLSQAAFHLRALGRLREAVEPMRAGLQSYTEQKNWKSAARVASNLSELELTLGDVPAAVRDAEQSVGLANRSGDAFLRMGFRTTLADALHQMGRRADAEARFREAEALQAERQPGCPLLYSLQGFQYCDLLLAGAERAAWVAGGAAPPQAGGKRSRQHAGDPSGLAKVCRDVERRAATALRIVMGGSRNLLDIAVNHLTLGRARLYRTILVRADPAEAQAPAAARDARSEIERAVDGLRNAGAIHHIPRGLLTRAWLRALTGDAAGARRDLDDAADIAERGPMPLFSADVHLHRARLFRDRAAMAEARRLIEKHGYRRRLEELADAEAAAERWS